ncbi:MAG: fumarylacetoacetate hydrolase family protein [Acetobacteraceae bacterium]|nr:fumarylacetoacetate hydrolase family protein [Acetobacteraceae bacterium]
MRGPQPRLCERRWDDGPRLPTLFARFSTGLVAHGQPLVVPKGSDFFDYGFELVAVIGKAGRRISEADALDHVAGYTIFNDGSVRDYQLRTPQWTIGKNFNSTGAPAGVYGAAA